MKKAKRQDQMKSYEVEILAIGNVENWPPTTEYHHQVSDLEPETKTAAPRRRDRGPTTVRKVQSLR